MKYLFIFFLASFFTQITFSQSNQLWKGYFSYNSVKDLTQSPNRFYAASENALFSKNIAANELKTINTIDGLPSEVIAAAYHSATLKKTLIGYENGLMVVINETNGKILKVVDIINKDLPASIKKINHFNEYNGIVYISCDFGIVQYNLNTLQFGDTYFMGNVTPEIVVTQTAVLNGYIYASTLTEGIRRAEITNPNLIDATQWVQVSSGSFNGITAFNNDLFAAATSGQIMRSSNGIAFSPFGMGLPSEPVDIRTGGDFFIVASASAIFVYNSGLVQVKRIDNWQIPDIQANFTCATSIGDTLYIGTLAHGVITTTIVNATGFQFISPTGPIRNNVFSINASSANLWVNYANTGAVSNPDPLQFIGISKYNSTSGWLNIPSSKLNNIPNLIRTTVNPSNENQIFVSSNIGGLLKLENDELVTVYDHTNTGSNGFESLYTTHTDVRVDESAYDKEGNLWMSNGLMKKALKVFRANGSWQSYNLDNVLSDYIDARLTRLTVDKNGTKWISTLTDGVVGFNETYNNGVGKKITEGEGKGNLPSKAVQATAIDKRNQLWIGTRKGLRVFSSVDRFLSEGSLETNRIIIEDEGLGSELLHDQFITAIVVDGSNNKWIGTLNAGVFHFSSNGQQTLHHFTIQNSPLPDNAINDIDINNATGEVFFATPKGLVSFKGNAINASDNLNNVLVYPNPVRPEFFGNVKITGLLDKANIKITDIEGNLVYETISEGGTIEWDTRAFGKYKVASGVYMIFISAQDGIETKVKKVMIIR